ncbi:MAG TPA: UDP-N-acetylmuramoyl-L-alanyl-D-glutamate--2,6-diaminopimelate ligase [Ardenticatenaceae bacterium]|nr:UDP-N-acetylmuramoyl-L-alanyl-D-glutamate--2,6-diaminopimelate ligase [Ardenticatenaceae bacterium]
MKSLEALLASLPAYQLSRPLPGDLAITAMTADSRAVRPGALFVAYRGVRNDLHRFIPDAVARGAAAIVAEQTPPDSFDVPVIVVPSGREALAWLAAAWFDHPSRQLRVIGVTGTDGKTTTSTLIASILGAMRESYGLVTTIGARIGDRELDTGFHTTTPDALPLQEYLREMVDTGARYAVLETTSHSFSQERVTSVAFDVGVITNITHEHLDEHGSLEAYRAAKRRLFESLGTSWRKPGTPKVAVLNADDSSYEMLAAVPVEVQISYAVEAPADVRARDVRYGSDGTRLVAETPGGPIPLHCPLLGPFNVSNILAAVATGLSQGASHAQIQAGISSVKGVRGRMDALDLGQEFLAVVDFAHTPNALARALEAARTMVGPDGRVIAVFGCAGLRDVQKRPWMGEIAARGANLTVITAEDPRTEDLDEIMEQIATGARRAGGREGESFVRIGDRAEAIAWAVEQARPGDIVIACGKGHEQSMCFGEVEYPWSEHEAMSTALAQRLERDRQNTPQ